MSALEQNTLSKIRANLGSLRAPERHTKVYKDECMFSFDTPLSSGGLFVNLKTFQGFGEDFVGSDHAKTRNELYLHIKEIRTPKIKDPTETVEKPSVFGIGVSGGFNVDKPEYDSLTKYELCIFPERKTVSWPNSELPEYLSMIIQGIVDHQTVSTQEEVKAWEEEVPVSKHADNLPQLDTGRKISPNPKTWKCEESGMTENIWLNLSTGHIGSGRKNWDGTGGTGAAEKHFEETGRQYPLVVKLGTITPEGADVYSYGEDSMVKDPHLEKHLAHWGINMGNMKKTEKTMAELQIDLNMSFEFDKITESGKSLVPVSGPGEIGLVNLGNSCYMNSVLQVLFAIPEMKKRYYDGSKLVFQTAGSDPAEDLICQTSKVAVGLLSDRYVLKDPSGHDPNAITLQPRRFKSLVGRGHSDFSSGRQQDAVEYFRHYLEKLSRAERTASDRLGGITKQTPDLFEFQTESRIQCGASGKVKYLSESNNVLVLPIPIDAATNVEELEAFKDRERKRAKLSPTSKQDVSKAAEEPVKPHVLLTSCLEKFTATETIQDFISSAIQAKTTASKRTLFKSFPRYLVVQLSRYYLAEDWTPKKLDVLVEMPETLDLEGLKSSGLQEGEELLPEDAATSQSSSGSAPASITPDEAIVAQLMSMGFSENACKKAAIACNNSSADDGMQWVLQHMEDADFNDPPAQAAPAGQDEPSEVVNQEAAMMLCSMGFTQPQVELALKSTDNDPDRAAEWLFSHVDELEALVAAAAADASSGPAPSSSEGAQGEESYESGKGKYSLVGFLSHMGSNTACGHYVAHIRKNGRWLIFNDDKVALSEDPPLAYGYMYLYKRDDNSGEW